jgi:hypothetical protein
LTYTPSGTLYYGDAYSVISGVSLSTATGAAATAGTHTIFTTGGTAANYNVNDVNGTLTVKQKALTITANNQTQTYGDGNNLTHGYAFTGLVSGDVVTASLSTNAATSTSGNWKAGAWTITLSSAGGADVGNYSVGYASGTLTVSQKALAITANIQTKVYGTAFNFTGAEFSTTGLVSGDAVGPVTLTSSGAPAGALVGSYTIGASSAAGPDVGDYAITYHSGTMTVAALSGSGYGSFYVLDHSAPGAVSVSGNGAINITGNLIVDSSSSTALSASGNAKVTAAGIQVVGSYQKSGNATLSPAPATGAQVVPDLLAGTPLPSIPSGLTNYGPKSVSGNSTANLSPGIYSQISLSGNAVVTMAPGTYVIQGGGFSASGNAAVTINTGGETHIIVEGGGFSVTGNASIKGTTVTIFNLGSSYNGTTDGGSYGALALSGNGTISLTPPSSGTYYGILIFQPGENAKALAFSGNAMQGVSGMIYAPAAQLTESGNAQIGTNMSMVVDTLSVSGNAIANGLTLNAPSGTVAYTPAQIRAAYGINNLSQDGTGQTIAIVDAYDDPSIIQSVDAFDTQFGLPDSGPSLYDLYGPASSFLTVLNQSGQATNLPAADPSGVGTDNWEIETALDVEWVHAVAPGAHIVLVEANSQSLSDLMAGVATAASQPGVSVVSMSWGFPEGLSVFAADEAAYDSVFNVPGVTFVASTGDYGVADPQYPAFSPNVVAVGGTSLYTNTDSSYNSETGWGYYASSVGASIGSGGGISQFETEPAYQQGVQSLGLRTTPDVSLVADPATGAWIADSYNLDPSNPFEVVGGTSLSAPAWAGLLALVNQGRAAAGEANLNSASPTEAQQALYSLPQSDYNVIASGSNGYSAQSGYNLVTGLGTPIAKLLVSDLVAYQGPGTSYSGPTVGALQNANLINSWTGGSSEINVFSVFDALPVGSNGLGSIQTVAAPTAPTSGIATGAVVTIFAPTATVSRFTTAGPGSALLSSFSANASIAASLGVNASLSKLTPTVSTPVNIPVFTTASTGRPLAASTAQLVVSAETVWPLSEAATQVRQRSPHSPMAVKPQHGAVLDTALDELATVAVLLDGHGLAGAGSTGDVERAVDAAAAMYITRPTDPMSQQNNESDSAETTTGLARLLVAVGLSGFGAGLLTTRKTGAKNRPLRRSFFKFGNPARAR